MYTHTHTHTHTQTLTLTLTLTQTQTHTHTHNTHTHNTHTHTSEEFQAYLDVPLPGLVHRVVEVAVGIRCLEVDGRGDNSRRQGLPYKESTLYVYIYTCASLYNTANISPCTR